MSSTVMVALQNLFVVMAMITSVTAMRPIAAAEISDSAKIAAICGGGSLMCADSIFEKVSGIQRNHSVHTINDLQRDFFLESALVVGGQMTLDANLRDAAPARAFLTSESASQMPTLTSSNALALIKHFQVPANSDMATATATAAYLCGYGALPGEKMTCAVSANAVAAFVASELGSHVKVLSTSGTPTTVPTVKAPVTIKAFMKGSVVEGQKIVVCHMVDFPASLYYCHLVTGTKVVTANLQAAASNSDIKAVGVCHIDTSLWLSTHPAFTALNIPRGDEACHWLIDSDLVFVPTNGNGDSLTE